MVAEKVPKTYPHIPALQRNIVEACLVDTQPMSRRVELSADDPRRIAPNIASVSAPPTSVLVEQQFSRFTSDTMASTSAPSETL